MYYMHMITCTPELTVPIPDTREEVLTLHAKAHALFNTAEFMEAFGVPTDPTEEDKVVARAVLHNSAEAGKEGIPIDRTEIIHTSASAKYLSTVLSEYDQIVVKSATQIRTYVTNKLIEESTNNDPKIRMKALELLGKIGDVGLFVEKSEITVKHKTTVELEASIKDRIAKLMNLRSRATIATIATIATEVMPTEKSLATFADDILDADD